MANEGGIKKMFKLFTMEPEDGEYDGRDDYLDGDEGSADAEAFEEAVSSRRSSSPVSNGFTKAEVLVVEPEVLNDGPVIVNKLKENKTVVVNLKNAEHEDAGRIFNFLSGAVYALEGTINQIAEQVFILAPLEVSVSTGMDKRGSDNISPILEWDQNY